MILEAEGFPLERQWFLVYRRGRRLSPAARAFREFVLEEAPRLAGSVSRTASGQGHADAN